MEDYVIFTDSCCDVSPELLAKWGVPYANMTFSFDGEDKEYIGTDISNHDLSRSWKVMSLKHSPQIKILRVRSAKPSCFLHPGLLDAVSDSSGTVDSMELYP